jgi:hypothetical protein
MKKVVLQVMFVFSFFALYSFSGINFQNSKVVNVKILTTKYQDGWKDGHCEGWKEEKGKNAYCPYAPYAPYPQYPKSSDSYRDGYNDGFLRGISDARK